MVVSPVGEDGGSGHTRYHTRERFAQSGHAPDQFVLHRPASLGGGGIPQGARVQGLSKIEDHHSSRWRGDTVSVEPASGNARAGGALAPSKRRRARFTGIWRFTTKSRWSS